ncbi:pantoate--beta-alanine ligase [Afifella marina DSM 2698]|nr:pantoate--beta-alanine ligase [Afifella marina DSM 2698]MBK1626626.1 pantoate--beta-alanine ligase [Afifella marina]MBK5916175.1 pantoate--beta-alanine ligase [Afifella marina]RAI21735.1 pantoate--beta-alanine ligase [Afifella marina DSM 2698]
MDVHPDIATSIANLRDRIDSWRAADETIALVPTMGALHSGHLQLVELAAERCDRVVVSIFVNPTQFGPEEDFSRYPRRPEADLEALARVGVPLVFAPSAEEMYPAGYATTVKVGGPSEGLESDFRPHFFEGVATVVSKLLISCFPDEAVFGEKDYQQLLVVRRLVSDLRLPTRIVAAPTAREADGLALSSRNAYLSAEERRKAPLIYSSLQEAAEALRAGAPVASTVNDVKERLSEAGFRVDYISLRHSETLQPLAELSNGPGRLLAAAWLGGTRLIDNIAV